jgi:hypothetical protein
MLPVTGAVDTADTADAQGAERARPRCRRKVPDGHPVADADQPLIGSGPARDDRDRVHGKVEADLGHHGVGPGVGNGVIQMPGAGTVSRADCDPAASSPRPAQIRVKMETSISTEPSVVRW